MRDVVPLLLLVLGAAALAVVAVRTGDDRVTQALACVAVVSLAWAAVSRYQRRDRARR